MSGHEDRARILRAAGNTAPHRAFPLPETPMRLPSHLLPRSMIRHEPYMAAMAVIAAGMFVGAWVIGPEISALTQ